MIKLTPGLRKFFQNVSWLTIDQMVRMGMNAVLTFLIARYYGKELYGTYNIAVAFVSLFAPIISLGFDGFIIRDLISHPEKKNEIMGTSFLLRVIGAALAISSIYIYIQFFYAHPTPQDALIKQLIYLLGLTLFVQSFDVVDLWFRSQLKAKYLVYSKSASFLLINAIKILCLILRAPMQAFAILTLLELTIGVIMMLRIYRKAFKARMRDWFATWSRVLYTLREGWPLLVSNLSSTFYARVDQLLIGQYLGVAFSGEFTASTKIYELMVVLTTILNSSIFPLLHKLYHQDRQLFRKRYILITEMYSLLGYFLVGFVMIFADKIVLLAYGKSFVGSADVLRIQIFGTLFMYNGSLRSTYLALTSNQRILVFTTFVSAILNLGLNIFLIPRYGILGAAFATAVTHFTSLQLFNLVFKSTRELFWIELRSFLPIETFRLARKKLL